MDVKKDLQDWQEKAKSAEADKINLEHDIGVLKDQLSAKRAECDRCVDSRAYSSKVLVTICNGPFEAAGCFQKR